MQGTNLIISYIPASNYEIRCYTTRESLTNSFSSSGILVHASFTPDPLPYAQRQTCTVGVPWPNEVFFYALVAVDDAGNRSPISNVLSVYIQEVASTTSTTTSPSIQDVFSRINVQDLSSVISPSEERSQQLKLYIAVGVVGGLVLLMLFVMMIICIRVNRKKAASTEEYDADDRDTYKAYEPTDKPPTTAATIAKPDVVPSPGGQQQQQQQQHQQQQKNLSHWLDSLPRSDITSAASRSPNTTAHDLSMEGPAGGTLRKHHTLTKTNPYRHKVLTNGSFLNLKDIPISSGNSGTGNSSVSDESSRPTTSTEDSGAGSSQSSESGDFLHSGPGSPPRTVAVQLKRSNTATEQVRAPIVHHQHQGSGGLVIDTSTARAIIDTYSGNLFSGSRHHLGGGSFRHPQQLQQQQQQQQQQNYIDQSVLVDQDSLEPNAGSYHHVIPAPPLFNEHQQLQHQQQQQQLHNGVASSTAGSLSGRQQSLRLRTESVV